MNITENERKVLVSLFENHYGTGGEGTWAWAVNESSKPSGIVGKELSGVVSSLQKKKLISCQDSGRDAAIYMTAEGKALVGGAK